MELQDELKQIQERINNSEFIDPKDVRRKEEIQRLIFGSMSIKKGREVTKGFRAKGTKSYGTGGKN